ncbi:ERG8, Phosphomevalonate kinase [Aulographum hederae CBS 113979]|uniref:Phosphomevalonate kinase n=1 Tax=Aulographum hederae CBS 113979 TaxID=1176131 RepID=A0A6G1GVM2_9PEZI|nr:ERG8, Phosphomevalonate kinase [Aulographum hederae CBS 113979]
MSSSHLSRKVVSAPGKVLLAGGYLVLDRKHTGLVFGLDARIHVQVQPVPTSSGVALSEIIVRSPQFKDAVWEYGYRLADHDGGCEVTQLRVSATSPLNQNPFVETALSYALTYISTLRNGTLEPVSITIFADNDYYSQPTPLDGATRTTRFVDFGVPLQEAHKTGLGSSAALVTAFTAALLVHYLSESAFSLSSYKGKRLLHNLAQASHCAAQGKVGSGFDVASAVFGTCLYRRFSPSLLESHGEPGSSGFATTLQSLVEDSSSKWDTKIIKDRVNFPKGVRLIMCDVDCGSKTPGMVKKVLSWRKEKPEEANRVWSALQESNEALATELADLANTESKDYAPLTQCIQSIRSLIRDMSRLSGVPIEPASQTKLLDACSNVPGVIGGVVPGAGGFDAVALLIEDDAKVIARLGDVLDGWNIQGQEGGGDGMDMGRVNVLGVREELEGIRVEDPSVYPDM